MKKQPKEEDFSAILAPSSQEIAEYVAFRKVAKNKYVDGLYLSPHEQYLIDKQVMYVMNGEAIVRDTESYKRLGELEHHYHAPEMPLETRNKLLDAIRAKMGILSSRTSEMKTFEEEMAF